MSDPRIIVALDYPAAAPALALASRLAPELCRLKVGKELFTAAGPSLVEQLVASGFEIFLDLKFHDIPSTVAKAVTAAANLGVWMVNVHAAGGPAMLSAAAEAVEPGGPLVIAVTVLTSIDTRQYEAIGYRGEIADRVVEFAQMACASGLDGVVCSAQEANRLRGLLGDQFALVTPGIRPPGTQAGDQQRIMTPAAAMAAGSDYLVIGRPITGAADPVQVIRGIRSDIGE
jgi:orotidine-5'-phosphate decarboxylase